MADQISFVQHPEKNEKAGTFSDDLEDIQECLRGEGEAYKRLVERHQSHVSKIMWRFSRDPGIHEELVHDAFVEAYFSLPKYRPKAPFSHWLARIATRVGYHYWRTKTRENREPAVPLQELRSYSDEIVDTLSAEEAADLLYRLLAQLPARDRLVLTLRYLEENSVEETAKITGWSKTMVKVQTLRAKRKIKKLFDRAKIEWIL